VAEVFFVKLHGAPVGGSSCFKNCHKMLDEKRRVRIIYIHMCIKSPYT
jgi:hypothetical protein